MNSTETLHADTPRQADSKLKRWKSAIAIGGMVAMAPVIVLIALLLIGSVLPLLVLGTPLLFHTPKGPRPPLAPPRIVQAPRTMPAPSPA